MQPYVSELEEYFAGQRREFTFPLDLRGTDFQLACWHALLAIPYGETRSYADIARAVGRPKRISRRRAWPTIVTRLRSSSPAIA
jgi:methylated-DNA-[protein]-cysteine S-methyltransferase